MYDYSVPTFTHTLRLTHTEASYANRESCIALHRERKRSIKLTGDTCVLKQDVSYTRKYAQKLDGVPSRV